MHIEKTAGTTLKKVFQQRLPFKFVHIYPITNGKFCVDNDFKLLEKIAIFKPLIYSSHAIRLDKLNLDYFDLIIVTVREPYARFHSHLNHLLNYGLRKYYNPNEVLNELKNHQLSIFGGKEIYEKNKEKLMIIDSSKINQILNDFFGINDYDNENISQKNYKSLKYFDDFKKINFDEIAFYQKFLKKHTNKMPVISFKSKSNLYIKMNNLYRRYYLLPLSFILNFLINKKITLKRYTMKSIY